jgi:hypothetical protein
MGGQGAFGSPSRFRRAGRDRCLMARPNHVGAPGRLSRLFPASSSSDCHARDTTD